VTVLVLTAPDDDTATRVCRELETSGRPYMQLDLGDFPESVSFVMTGPNGGWAGHLSNGCQELALSQVTAVYYRRPSSFRLPAELPVPHRRFAAAEARHGWAGLLSSLRVRYVNHPARVADAGFSEARPGS
jgi:hypothetical protein